MENVGLPKWAKLEEDFLVCSELECSPEKPGILYSEMEAFQDAVGLPLSIELSNGWLCWVRLMKVGVQPFLEGHQFLVPALMHDILKA